MFINENNLKELPQADVIPPSLELDSAASVRGDNFIMGEEIWKWINWMQGHYEVSNYSRVRCWYDYDKKGEHKRKEPRILKQTTTDIGYLSVSIRIAKNIRKGRLVHVLSATEFIPNPLNLPEVNHLDGDKANNYVLNFEWSTHANNVKHAWDSGLRKEKVGERWFNRVYSDEQIMEIYTMDSWQEIRNKFGIANSSIQRIKSGETWKHLTGGKNNIKRKCTRKKIKNDCSIVGN